MRKIILIIVALGALALPATASAKYYVNQTGAERYAALAAVQEYGDYGIHRSTVGTHCDPQYHGFRHNWPSNLEWHRWSCAWVGDDADGDTASGMLVVIGGSGYVPFRYRIIRGIRWDF